MKPFLYLFTAALTAALVFLWACARLADRRPVVSAQATSPVGSGPYTAFARHPADGSSGPHFSVTAAKDDSPGECGARLDIHRVAQGVLRIGVGHPNRYSPVPPELRDGRFRPLPGYQEVYALATDHHGKVVGYCQSSGSGAWTREQARALLWRRGRARALETLPGYQITHAVALSDRGVIVGDATVDSFPTSMNDPGHAVCWVGGKVRDLGTGWALAVNNAGQIVGDSGTGPADYFHDAHALLWAHGDRYDLNDYIPKRSGWLLVQATRIDGRGRIAGCGTFHGSAHAFLLTPR